MASGALLGPRCGFAGRFSPLTAEVEKNNQKVIGMPRILLFALFTLLVLSASASATGYLCAVGGGSENYNAWSDGPYRWMVEKSGYGPALVLHYSEGSVWLENYFTSFGASSARSLVVGSAAAANDSAAYKTIRASRLIFLRGGDQSRYYILWKGSLVEKAIREVWEGGGVIGGTSAGLAVLGEVDYTAETPASATSDDALANPFHRDITLRDDFLSLAAGVIFDSHFTARVRLGRLAAFVARWRQSHGGDLLGVGVDENTAVCLSPDHSFEVMGAGSVTLLEIPPQSEFLCSSGRPLSFTGWKMHLLTPGFGYDLRSRTVVRVPPKAVDKSPQWQAPPQPHARMLLAGGSEPVQMQGALKELVSRAGGDSLLLLGGGGAGLFAPWLKSYFAFDRLRLVTLDAAAMQSDALAAALGRARAVLVAGLSAAEVADCFNEPSPVSAALQGAVARPECTLMLAGAALPLCGDLRVADPEYRSTDLVYGRLAVAPGLSLLPSSAWSFNSFYSDDFRENRLGGLYWLLHRDPGLLGLALDRTSIVACADGELVPQSTQPVLILDLQHAVHFDSSDYRHRASYPPRQSVGFCNALLHCRSLQDSSAFDLAKRTWRRLTPAGIGRGEAPAAPSGYALNVQPNPGYGTVAFNIHPQPAAGPVTLTIYNLRGQAVRRLHSTAPAKRLLWDGLDSIGLRPSSGTYLAVMAWRGHRARSAFTLLH